MRDTDLFFSSGRAPKAVRAHRHNSWVDMYRRQRSVWSVQHDENLASRIRDDLAEEFGYPAEVTSADSFSGLDFVPTSSDRVRDIRPKGHLSGQDAAFLRRKRATSSRG